MATKINQSALQAAFLAFGEALGLEIPAVNSSGKAGATVAASPSGSRVIGTPSLPNGYFSTEQVANGQGYGCTNAKPCKRLLQGPNRTSRHNGQKSHKPVY